jgi:hypothetical protein
VLNGGARFEVTCADCGTRLLVVNRIRDAEARTMADHLQERHPELGIARTAAMGELFAYYRVRPMR